MKKDMHTYIRIALSLCLVWCIGGGVAHAAAIRVECATDKTEASVGESILYQIQINGSNDAQPPSFPPLPHCHVEYIGAQPSNSSSVSIINGKVNRIEKKRLLLNYRLTPSKTGTIRIPGFPVQVEGKTFTTLPVNIKVKNGERNDAFELEVSLSHDTAYVGQPITLSCSWKVSQQVEAPAFQIPLLDDSRIELIETDLKKYISTPRALLNISINNKEMQMYQRTIRWKGEDALEVRKTWTLIPNTAGTLRFDPARVVCKALVGYKRSKRKDPFERFGRPFGDMDDFFGRQKVFKTFVTPSSPLALQVRPLPKENRPAGFSGLVGKYSLDTSATPTDVRVGDPITLTIRVTGPSYLDNVDLPPLTANKELADNFKIPAERAPGKEDGAAKIFTQTIRASREDVREIPAISLPYFDIETGEYAIARSQPIALNVTPARVVTAQDIETIGTHNTLKSRLEDWQQGIAHNYESLDILRDQRAGPSQWFHSAGWITLILCGPVLYLLSLLATWWRSRLADTEGRRIRQAFAQWKHACRDIAAQPESERTSHLLDAIRAYLADRLQLTGGALTEADVRRILTGHHIDKTIVERCCTLLHDCEACRYAGNAVSPAEHSRQLEEAQSIIESIERSLP